MSNKSIKKSTDSKSDTTKIPKPYKYSFDEDGLGKSVYIKGSRIITKKPADSTVMKAKYNNKIVIPAILKRNSEREKEGKKPIAVSSIFGGINYAGLSKSGKTFKESPLKMGKKKINNK